MMQYKTFSDVLKKTAAKIEAMKYEAETAGKFLEEGKILSAYESSVRLEELSERTTLLTRALPVYSGSPYAKAEVDNAIRMNMPIEIGYTQESWFSVRVPVLLPKKNSLTVDFIRTPLYMAMREFFGRTSPVRYKDCVLVFRHVYDRSRPERKKRDHDNIEIKAVSDAVALYVMPDDGPSVCSHYYCSAEGASERTEVYVVPKNDFPKWLEVEKNMPDEGMSLSENRPK